MEPRHFPYAPSAEEQHHDSSARSFIHDPCQVPFYEKRHRDYLLPYPSFASKNSSSFLGRSPYTQYVRPMPSQTRDVPEPYLDRPSQKSYVSYRSIQHDSSRTERPMFQTSPLSQDSILRRGPPYPSFVDPGLELSKKYVSQVGSTLFRSASEYTRQRSESMHVSHHSSRMPSLNYTKSGSDVESLDRYQRTSLSSIREETRTPPMEMERTVDTPRSDVTTVSGTQSVPFLNLPKKRKKYKRKHVNSGDNPYFYLSKEEWDQRLERKSPMSDVDREEWHKNILYALESNAFPFPGPPYECPICGKIEKRKTEFRIHVKTHIPSAKKEHVCHICGFAFLRSQHLTRHMVIHSSERNFKCDLCSKSFYRAESLRKHAASHSQEDKEVTAQDSTVSETD